ncbi:MAG: TIGR00297 family protein [Halobacteriaceae archaeon]
MTSSLRRATAFALVATLALSAPVLGRLTVVPFGLVAVAAFFTSEGPLFELFARPGDRREGRLVGLASFALGAGGLALLTAGFGMPVEVYVATVLLVGYGNLAATATLEVRAAAVARAIGYTVGAFLAGVAGQVAAATVAGGVGATPAPFPRVVFLAAAGALLAALIRSAFVGEEDPLVVFTVGFLLWLFADLQVSVGWVTVTGALAVTVGLGYVSWALDTASVTGMLTGVLLALLTLVLGGYQWLVILVAFFAVGSLATKFRYGEKQERGVAEPEGGARGTGNILGNSAPALLAVVLFAASPRLPLDPVVFEFAFAGSVATALADTLSSEIGGLYDDPRLVTTLEPVAPGTDGAVTWQGELAGLGGAATIAGLALALFGLPPTGAVAVAAAGVAGMTVDSVLGATVEGDLVGNRSVNFLATGAGAVVGGALAVALGL